MINEWIEEYKPATKEEAIHLSGRAKDSGDWKGENMSEDDFKKLLHDKINSVSMDAIKKGHCSIH